MALALVLAPLFAACNKQADGTTCTPAEHSTFKIRVLIQPAELINPDDQGASLATELRIYQLGSDAMIPTLDFRDVWQNGAAAFGDAVLGEETRTVYPGRPEVLELQPEPEATHLLAVAIMRQPTGVSWYRLWDLPKFHGDSVCQAQRQGKQWPDPCFYLSLERNAVDGGHTPPPGWDPAKTQIVCPGPPLKVKPAPPPPKKAKKKRKKLKDLKAPKVPEAPKAPEAPTMPEAPAVPEAPKMPAVP